MRVPDNNFFIFGSLIVLAFLLFGNGIGGDFVLDDRSVIVGNPMVEDLSVVFKAFLNPYYYDRPQSGLYRPLTLASYSLDWHLFSGNSSGFHVVNIILHATISFLIFLIVLNLKDRLTAWVSSLMFLFLPIHVESVTSVVGRGELLALLFFVLAFYAVQLRNYKTSSVLFFLSILSKEIGIVFIPVFMFFEVVWRKTPVLELFKKTAYFFPPLIIYSFLRYYALGSDYFLSNNAYSFFNPILTMSFLPGLWTAFKVLCIYAQKTVFPTYFSSDYSYNQIVAVYSLLSSWQALVGVIILAAIIYLSVIKRNSLVGLGSVIFLFSYLIVSNLFVKIGTIMAERLMYMPSFGLVLMSSEVFSNLLKNYKKMTKLFWLVFVLLLFVFGIQIVRGNALWKNEKTLFENAYKHAPNSVVNITNMASILFKEGRSEEALEKINTALNIEPKNSPTLHLAGQIYNKIGKDKMAEEFWQKAIQAQPDYLYPYLSLGTLYYQRGDFKSGEEILFKAKEIYTTPNVVTLLALNEIGFGEYAKAIDLIKEKFGEKPKEYELRFVLGVAYLKLGNDPKAKELLLGLKEPALSEEVFIQNLKNTKIFNVEI